MAPHLTQWKPESLQCQQSLIKCAHTPSFLALQPWLTLVQPHWSPGCSWPSFHIGALFVADPSSWNGLPPVIPLPNFLVFKSVNISACSSSFLYLAPSSCSLSPLLCSSVSFFCSAYHLLIYCLNCIFPNFIIYLLLECNSIKTEIWLTKLLEQCLAHSRC